MALKRWIFAETDAGQIEKLSKELGLSRLAATALVSRGLGAAEDALRFLNCDYALGDPMLLKDMEKGAARIQQAAETGERIAIFGDYDVDGIMSTALLHTYLESIGADVVSLLPTREGTGYGLVVESVDEIAALGAGLIVTVDNGISSHEAVAYANTLGIDTVISDHHKVPEVLPEAYAVIDPLRPDDESAFKGLAGVGVALKLAAAIEQCDIEEMLSLYGYFAAIGTVSDVMPLVDENRLIVKEGLEQLRDEENIGLSALIRASGLDSANIGARDVAFMLAPRLNAAGRMASAETALALMLTDDWDTANALAEELSELNCRRQKAEQEMIGTMEGCIDADLELLKKPILVLSSADYNPGVAGIVCSRLVERFGKPAIVISIDGEEGKGTSRSLEGFSLYNAIDSCVDLLDTFGGHDMAAGFTVGIDKIDTFKERLYTYCRGLPEPIPYRRVHVSGAIEFADIGEREVEELLCLAPFGSKNGEPVFATLSAEVAEVALLGERHTRITFLKNGGKLKAALFGVAPDELLFKRGDRVDIAYTLSLYLQPNGRNCVSVKLRTIAPEGFAKEDFSTLKIFDRMCFGQKLSAEERAKVAPTREDIAVVYRMAKERPIPLDDRERLCFMFWDMPPGRVLAALTVLQELGLLKDECCVEKRCLAAEPNPAKRELSDSKTYRLLHGDEA